MATNNSINYKTMPAISGTGSYVLSVSPTINQPAQTGTINAGTPGGSSLVGDVVSAQLLAASAISLSTATTTIVVAMSSLFSGDFDLYGNVYFNASSGMTDCFAYIGTSTTSPANQLLARYTGLVTSPTIIALNIPPQRLQLSSGTVYRLYANATFATGTVTVCGQCFARVPR